jgi:hypothetical protein
MKWLAVAAVLVQAPFLFIIFIMAGTDGRRESLISVWLAVIPLAILSVITLVNAFAVREWNVWHWLLAAAAVLPAVLILARSFLR